MGAVCYQVNLQNAMGGGEIYARALTEALERLGWRSVMLIAKEADFWPALLPASVELRAVAGEADFLQALPPERSLIVTHTVLSDNLAPAVAARHSLTGILHMPLYERKPRGLLAYERVFPVSEHVRASALAAGLRNVHAEALYAVADLRPRLSAAPVRAASPYEWDKRKLRDRLLGWLQVPAAGRPKRFARLPGLGLGIVSRLTPIKQFPLMFSLLAPVLGRYPDVHIEIFGAGGYASVRDLCAALRPIRKQVRFWGRQGDVASVYPLLDYVLGGLPEKEALGLNLIEAQACGTPVLAVRAPPFTETVAEGSSGFFFEDPRRDQGADFARLLERIRNPGQRPDPHRAPWHLERFGMDAFAARVGRALAAVS